MGIIFKRESLIETEINRVLRKFVMGFCYKDVIGIIYHRSICFIETILQYFNKKLVTSNW